MPVREPNPARGNHRVYLACLWKSQGVHSCRYARLSKRRELKTSTSFSAVNSLISRRRKETRGNIPRRDCCRRRVGALKTRRIAKKSVPSTRAWLGSSGGSASARMFLCRGLGSRWFTEWFHGNALVAHFQHAQVFGTARQLKDYAVTRCRLHQRASQR